MWHKSLMSWKAYLKCFKFLEDIYTPDIFRMKALMGNMSFLWLGWRRDLWIFLWVDVALCLRSSRFVPYGDTAWVVRSEKERQTDLESMCLRESKHSMCLSSKRMFCSDLMDLMLHDATKGSSLQRCLYVVQLISLPKIM